MDILQVVAWLLVAVLGHSVYRLAALYWDLKQRFIELDGKFLQMKQDGATIYDVKVVQASVDEMREDWRLRRLATVLDAELPERLKALLEMIETARDNANRSLH
jgi:hypothetical protein